MGEGKGSGSLSLFEMLSLSRHLSSVCLSKQRLLVSELVSLLKTSIRRDTRRVRKVKLAHWEQYRCNIINGTIHFPGKTMLLSLNKEQRRDKKKEKKKRDIYETFRFGSSFEFH